MRDWKANEGQMTAPRGAKVEVKLRNGGVGAGYAGRMRWSLTGGSGDIVEWRLAEGAKPGEASGGIKHDQDKPRMDLLDPYAIEVLAKVLTFGAQKYAAHNWRKGINKSRLLAAALRHLFAYLGGQDNDPETGLSHVGHAMCCCMFLLGLENRPELDDRFKP